MGEAIEEVAMRVKDLMTPDVVAVRPDTSLKEVARTLAEHGISGVPVVSERDQLVGVVSEADILFKEHGSEPRSRLLDWLDGNSGDREKLAARTAAEAMTSPVLTIGAHTDVSEAAREMTERGVNRLPVIDWSGALVGIITRADLVRAFARTDDEIEKEIRSDIVKGTLWIDAGALDIDVQRGEVVLAGELERRTDAELLERLVSRVPGVVSVRDSVAWRDDDTKLPREYALIGGIR
jgi:CBS domain-containing protein